MSMVMPRPNAEKTQSGSDKYENLIQEPQGDAMLLFMWQNDIISVARFIDA